MAKIGGMFRATSHVVMKGKAATQRQERMFLHQERKQHQQESFLMLLEITMMIWATLLVIVWLNCRAY